MQTEVYTVNAFTYRNQGGNPAGVVLNADVLNADQMQNIACKMGYPETAFLCSPPTASEADMDVRFFTPITEVDFCGHATLATFYLLWQQGLLSLGSYKQLTRAGLLDVSILDDGLISMSQKPPQFKPTLSAQTVAPLLNLPIDALDPRFPPQDVSTGLPDLFIGVKSGYLRQITPDLQAISELSKQNNLTGLHVFELTPNETYHANCRNFAPLYGIDEEPATGSASGALACYLQHHHSPLQTEYRFLQGQSQGQTSQINVKLTVNDKNVIQVQASGTAQLIQQQQIQLSDLHIKP